MILLLLEMWRWAHRQRRRVKEGDEIVAVNKNFTQNLNQYKLAMQVANEKLKLIIRRNGELMEKEFKVKSIF
jgi:C-terminal processing protease CtpA/Prc